MEQPRVVAALQPWAEIIQRLRRYWAELANAFGVFIAPFAPFAPFCG
jgi:hypothetical protein